MNAQTRQTFIGTVGLTTVMIVALIEGFNGRVTAAYFVSMVALVAPEALDQLPFARGP